MILKESAEYILKSISDSLERLDEEQIDILVDSLFSKKRIFVYGVGRSGFVGKCFAMRLMHIGFKVYTIGETVTPPLSRHDSLILISGSGETKNVVKIAAIAKKIGAELIAITENEKSTLVKLADKSIFLHIEKDGNRSKLAPLGTLFESTTAIFLDSLITDLMDRAGENEVRMKARHSSLE